MGEQPAFAVEEFEAGDLASLVFEQRDAATLSEGMQHPLFVSGNIHLNVSCLWRRPQWAANKQNLPPASRTAVGWFIHAPSQMDGASGGLGLTRHAV